MPLPLVHFAIAVEIARIDPIAFTPPFLLGSIAPDAIHMRAATVRRDKDRTHLLAAPHTKTTDQAYYEVIRQFLTRYWHEGSAATALAEGYAAHVLADRIWLETVLRAFRAARPPDMTGEAGTRLYYQEVDQVDMYLYRYMPWRAELWQQVARAKPLDFADLLTAEEIRGWRERTFNWFKAREHEPLVEPRYITYTSVMDFIADAAVLIRERFTAWKTQANRWPVHSE